MKSRLLATAPLLATVLLAPAEGPAQTRVPPDAVTMKMSFAPNGPGGG
jgi:hypothetical protein